MHLVEQLRCCLSFPPISEYPAWVPAIPLLIQHPALGHWGRQSIVAQVSGPSHPHGRLGLHSVLLASAWPSAGCHRHFGHEPVDGKISMCRSLFLCLWNTIKNVFDLIWWLNHFSEVDFYLCFTQNRLYNQSVPEVGLGAQICLPDWGLKVGDFIWLIQMWSSD